MGLGTPTPSRVFLPALADCQEHVYVGSGGVRSRVRRIFAMFHNPLLRPVALGGSVPSKAFMITVQATHVRGMPAHAYPLRQRGEMHPRAGAPAPHSPHRIPRKTGLSVGWVWPALGGFGVGARTAYSQPTGLPYKTERRVPSSQSGGSRRAEPLPWLWSPGTDLPLHHSLAISPAVQVMW